MPSLRARARQVLGGRLLYAGGGPRFAGRAVRRGPPSPRLTDLLAVRRGDAQDFVGLDSTRLGEIAARGDLDGRDALTVADSKDDVHIPTDFIRAQYRGKDGI